MLFVNSQNLEASSYVYFLLTQGKRYLSMIWKQFIKYGTHKIIKYGTKAYLLKFMAFDIHKDFNSFKCLQANECSNECNLPTFVQILKARRIWEKESSVNAR